MRSFILPKDFQVTMKVAANSAVSFGRFTITSSESTVTLKLGTLRELSAPKGDVIAVKVFGNRAYLGVDGRWRDSTYLNESSLNYTHVTLEGEGVDSFEVIDLAGMPEHQIAGVISADTVDPVAEFDFLQRFKTPIGLVTDATFDGGLKVLPSNTVTTVPANLHSDFCLVFDFNRGGDFVVFEQGQLKVEVTSGSVMLTVEETEISVPFIQLPSNRIVVDRFGTSITLQCNHDTASIEHSSPITSERPSVFQGYSGTVEAVAYASHSVLKGATCSQKKVKNRRSESASVTVDRLQPGWVRVDRDWQLDFVDGEFINLAFEVFADNTQIANLLKTEGGKVIAFGVDVGDKGVCFLSLLPTGNRVTIFRDGVELGEVDLSEVKLAGLEGDYTLFSACVHERQVWPSLQYRDVEPVICEATADIGSTVPAVSTVDELGRMFTGSVEVISSGLDRFVKIAEVVSGESRLFLDCFRADVLATGRGENSLPLGSSFTSDKFLLKYGTKTFNIPAVEDEDNLEGRLTETTPKVRTSGRVLSDLVSVLSDPTSNEEAVLKSSLFAGELEDQPFPTDAQTVSVLAKIEPVDILEYVALGRGRFNFTVEDMEISDIEATSLGYELYFDQKRKLIATLDQAYMPNAVGPNGFNMLEFEVRYDDPKRDGNDILFRLEGEKGAVDEGFWVMRRAQSSHKLLVTYRLNGVGYSETNPLLIDLNPAKSGWTAFRIIFRELGVSMYADDVLVAYSPPLNFNFNLKTIGFGSGMIQYDQLKGSLRNVRLSSVPRGLHDTSERVTDQVLPDLGPHLPYKSFGGVDFYGLVSGNSQAVSTLAGFTKGSVEWMHCGWIKVRIDGKLLYVAKRPMRVAVGAYPGIPNKTVTIDGRRYRLRTLDYDWPTKHYGAGVSQPPQYYNSEWNRIMYRLASRSGKSAEGIPFGEFFRFKDGELCFGPTYTSDGSYSIIVNGVARYNLIGGSGGNWSGTIGINPKAIAWRPVLELLED